MIALMVAAPASGSGKTVFTCALLAALARRGLTCRALKCGPDYIDPMFHRSVLGVESRNADLFLSEADELRRQIAAFSRGADALIAESAMGYYDGLGAVTTRVSAFETAEVLHFPTLLVVPARGAALSLAAVVRGLRDFRTPSGIRGVVLNGCHERTFSRLQPVLERETGLPVLGFLPHIPEAEIPSRHLGLLTAGEIADLDARLTRLADALEAHVDLKRLSHIFERSELSAAAPAVSAEPTPPRARIAVARDEAFCFLYPETLTALKEQGAELCFFSPLRDACLPAGTGALYLPGGYPENHAKALAANAALRRSIARAVSGGLPTLAECGGFLYLGAALEGTDGVSWPMAGVLPGLGANSGRLVRFGYASIRAEKDSLLFRAGEKIPVHEFHHFESSAPGRDLLVEKPLGGDMWRCGYVSPTLYAAFPHLYLAGRIELAARFVSAARNYGREHGLGTNAE